MPTVDSPMHDARAESKAVGLLVHGAGQGAQDWLPGVLRSATNAADALPAGTAIEVVIQGPGVALLSDGSGFAAEITAAGFPEIHLGPGGGDRLVGGAKLKPDCGSCHA